MLKRLRSRLHGEGGFTLIELLVVILIIGILAAIAIPSFLSQKSKGQDAATKSDARTAQTALETWYTDNNNYSAAPSDLRQIEKQIPTTGVTVTHFDGTGSTGDTDNYKVGVLANGRTFYIGKDSAGAVFRTCSVSNVNDPGGCKTGGSSNGSW